MSEDDDSLSESLRKLRDDTIAEAMREVQEKLAEVHATMVDNPAVREALEKSKDEMMQSITQATKTTSKPTHHKHPIKSKLKPEQTTSSRGGILQASLLESKTYAAAAIVQCQTALQNTATSLVEAAKDSNNEEYQKAVLKTVAAMNGDNPPESVGSSSRSSSTNSEVREMVRTEKEAALQFAKKQVDKVMKETFPYAPDAAFSPVVETNIPIQHAATQADANRKSLFPKANLKLTAKPPVIPLPIIKGSDFTPTAAIRDFVYDVIINVNSEMISSEQQFNEFATRQDVINEVRLSLQRSKINIQTTVLLPLGPDLGELIKLSVLPIEVSKILTGFGVTSLKYTPSGNRDAVKIPLGDLEQEVKTVLNTFGLPEHEDDHTSTTRLSYTSTNTFISNGTMTQTNPYNKLNNNITTSTDTTDSDYISSYVSGDEPNPYNSLNRAAHRRSDSTSQATDAADSTLIDTMSDSYTTSYVSRNQPDPYESLNEAARRRCKSSSDTITTTTGSTTVDVSDTTTSSYTTSYVSRPNPYESINEAARKLSESTDATPAVKSTGSETTNTITTSNLSNKTSPYESLNDAARKLLESSSRGGISTSTECSLNNLRQSEDSKHPVNTATCSSATTTTGTSNLFNNVSSDATQYSRVTTTSISSSKTNPYTAMNKAAKGKISKNHSNISSSSSSMPSWCTNPNINEALAEVGIDLLGNKLISGSEPQVILSHINIEQRIIKGLLVLKHPIRRVTVLENNKTDGTVKVEIVANSIAPDQIVTSLSRVGLDSRVTDVYPTANKMLLENEIARTLVRAGYSEAIDHTVPLGNMCTSPAVCFEAVTPATVMSVVCSLLGRALPFDEQKISNNLKKARQAPLSALNLRNEVEKVFKCLGIELNPRNVSTLDFFKFTHLPGAMADGDLETIKKIIPSEVDADTEITDGMPLLSIIIRSLSQAETREKFDKIESVILYLLECGADAKHVNHNTRIGVFEDTCMLMANSKLGIISERILECLVLKGADPNQLNPNTFQNPMYWVISDPVNIELSDCLLRLGCLVSSETAFTGMNLVHHLFTNIHGAVTRGCDPSKWSSSKLCYLLNTWLSRCPQLISSTDKTGATILHTAALFGINLNVINLLLEAGCDPNYRNDIGATPYEVAQSLVVGCDPDSKGKASVFLQPYMKPPVLRGTPQIPLSGLIKWKHIQRGLFGNVFTATFKAIRETVTVKQIINQDHHTREFVFNYAELLREISQLHSVRCKFITGFYGCAEQEDGTIFMVSEHFDTTLDIVIRESSHPPLIRFLGIASSIGKALLFIHVNQQVHNDVACRNIFLNRSGSLVKLGSFQLACKINEVVPRIAILWSCPEFLSQPPHKRRATASADIWSLGVLLWELYSNGSLPYDHLQMSQLDVRSYVLNGGMLLRPDACPELVWNDLIEPCLKTDPEERINLTRFLERIEDFLCDSTPIDSSDDQQDLSVDERLKRALLREQHRQDQQWPKASSSDSWGSSMSSPPLPDYQKYSFYDPSADLSEIDTISVPDTAPVPIKVYTHTPTAWE